MSKTIHPIGRILKGNGLPKVAKEVEEALELHRPGDCLDRLSSVYTREIPDFSKLGLECGYIYLVQILGNFQKHDACWVGKLQLSQIKQKRAWCHEPVLENYPNRTNELVSSCCNRYWTGSPSPKPLWELLSRSAEVKELLSNGMVQAAATKGGWRPPCDA